MSKIKEVIFLCVFLIIIGTPYLSWEIFEEFFQTENTENRVMSELPQFSVENIEKFPAEFENYINDNLPYRSSMIRIHNYHILSKMFNVSSDERVIIGRGGWLFYNALTDGDTIKAYTGRNLFTEEELQLIANNIEETQKNLS